MFNIATIKTNLINAIGLRNTDNPDLPDCTLTTSETGIYFNDYHPLITYENLYYIAPNYDGMGFDTWSATGAYATGDLATYANVAYEALTGIAATSTTPDNLASWSSPVNSWITEKKNASINKLCNKIQNNKKNARSTKTLLDSVQLIEGAGRYSDTITPSSRFVGFEIIPKYTNNISAIINNIGVQFTAAQTGLNLYLFHSSQYSPIGTFSVTTTGTYSFDWISASASLSTGSYSMPYVDYTNNIDAGGSFYFGYFEDDITGNAIEKDWSNCYKSTNYNLITKWLDIRPIEVSTLNGTNLFDIDDVGYTDSNYGLNLNISVTTDITELLVNNKTLFTDAYGYQFAIDMLNEMLHNPNSRINRSQENATRNTILYELTESQNDNNLISKLKESVDALGFDFSEISQVLPKSVTGIKRRRL